LERGFTAQQASKLSSCTNHQLRYWDRIGMVPPKVQGTGGRPGVRRLYAFEDLVALRVIKGLLDNGMSLQRVRRAWEYMKRAGDIQGGLSSLKLVSDGVSIFTVSADEGEILDALREGQMAFFVALDRIARQVEEDVSRFDLDRERFLDVLRRVEDDVREEGRSAVNV